MSQLRIATFGACHVHNPVFDLQKRGLAKSVVQELGSRNTLYSHSVEQTEQLIDFYRGKVFIPQSVRRHIYYDPDFEPTQRNGKAIDSAEVALVEIVAPFRLRFRDYWLNRNEVHRKIVEPPTQAKSPHARLASSWYQGLMKPSEEIRLKFAEELLPHMDNETEDHRTDRAIVSETRGEKVPFEELKAGVARIRESLAMPIGMMPHALRYMPDGRPITWPPEFRDQLEAICKELDIPFMVPSDLVQSYGAEKALKDNFTYYSDEFIPYLADRYLEFAHICVEHASKRRRQAQTRSPAPNHAKTKRLAQA